jgi:hypothetical protein
LLGSGRIKRVVLQIEVLRMLAPISQKSNCNDSRDILTAIAIVGYIQSLKRFLLFQRRKDILELIFVPRNMSLRCSKLELQRLNCGMYISRNVKPVWNASASPNKSDPFRVRQLSGSQLPLSKRSVQSVVSIAKAGEGTRFPCPRDGF